MCTGLIEMRVSELCVPPRRPVCSLIGVPTVRSWAWLQIIVPSGMRWETTARADTVPLRFFASIHSLSRTPIFSASYSGLFKSFFDLVDVDAMEGKPVLIAATGGSPRHSMVLDHALRPLFGYLRTVVVPTGVYAASEDWASTSGDTATLSDRIRRAATQLVALMPTGTGRRAVASQASDADRGEQRIHAGEEAGIANFARLLAGD